MICCLAIDIINADKPPASLAFLAGACETAGVDYFCYSLNSEMIRRLSQSQYQKLYNNIKLDTVADLLPEINQHIDNLITDIANLNPNLITVSLFSYFQMPIAQVILQKLKAAMPTVEIIAGGPGTYKTNQRINNAELLKSQGLIDYYLLGEGDEILPKFLKGDRTCTYLNSNQFVPQINNLDQIFVMPSYKNIDFSSYQSLENTSKGVISITTSRGCVRSCSFCDIAQSWPKFRFRSGQNIAQEVLQHFKDTGITNFYITDSLINGSIKSFTDFNLEMIKIKQQEPALANFAYNGMFIVRNKKSHTEEFFKNMKAAGCESLAIGVETGSDRLRWDMNKKFTNADLDHHLEMSSKYKIKNFLLMFVGYPTETDEDFEQTLQILERYQKYLLDGTIGGINFSGIFTMIPDSPVYDHRMEMGIEIVDMDDAKLNWINKNNPDLTIKKRILRDLAFRKRAAELRYPVPYTKRYLEYLQHVDSSFVPKTD
jgi:anaerobic magnesium-protoporphyrin IX monomethyl ester cyclase